MIHGKYSTASDCEQVKYDKLHLSLPLNELLGVDSLSLFTRSAASTTYIVLALTEYMILTYIKHITIYLI